MYVQANTCRFASNATFFLHYLAYNDLSASDLSLHTFDYCKTSFDYLR